MRSGSSSSEYSKVKAVKVTAANAETVAAQFRESVSFAIESAHIVGPILKAVAEEGDGALLRFTEKFDGPRLSVGCLRVGPEEMESGWKALSGNQRRAIRRAIRNIRAFHEKSLPKGWTERTSDGITVGERFYPIRRAGLYVPGGRVPLVSTVLMTAVPALAAGVPAIVVCTPPAADGSVAEGLLGAFHALGIREVYRVGGAQAIAAMAFGTKSIPAVDLIAGPGNAFVMEAKRQVFGRVGIDLLPGPSEVMVIADDGARPDWVAADLLSQAEHGTGKEKLYLAVGDRDSWKRIRAELERQAENWSDGGIVGKILESRLLVGICAGERVVFPEGCRRPTFSVEPAWCVRTGRRTNGFCRPWRLLPRWSLFRRMKIH